jgi:hypothetical protein
VDLPSVSNAPRALSIGGATYRARALTLWQLGELLAWLEDRISGGARPVPLSSDSARLALATTDGLAVLLHLSLVSCHPRLTRDRARAMVGDLDAEAEARLLAIAFRRRPGYTPPEDGDGKDLAESDWGAIWEGLSGHRADRYEAVGQLTLDQLDNYFARGELEGLERLAPAEVQAMWEAARAAETPDGDAQPTASSR